MLYHGTRWNDGLIDYYQLLDARWITTTYPGGIFVKVKVKVLWLAQSTCFGVPIFGFAATGSRPLKHLPRIGVEVLRRQWCALRNVRSLYFWFYHNQIFHSHSLNSKPSHDRIPCFFFHFDGFASMTDVQGARRRVPAEPARPDHRNERKNMESDHVRV